ncbi:efflux RND transporter periplasmic adaptor subunit [Desulfovibrio psychrotolerans]|uniref:RND transporter n=1 Tax=Desulfovibrio psychrotolerans TaxID=415242 RepID=A0A7J0BRR6_9BACT|nr:efflux RND transporter periplasmic adaptor subunit [Desulfovibrio psychrotolerans]GFM35835.1 RND transporter [Desulfovibrio psychrotolerans]
MTTPFPLASLRRPSFFTAAALLFAVLLAAGCGNGDSKPAQPKGVPAVPVTVVEVAQQATPLVVTAVGNVQPQATVQIKTQVGGIIVEQRVRDGQSVREGDLLFRLDPRPFELVIREAQARLDRNRVQLAKAAKDLERYAQLSKINAVAQEQYDKTYAEAKSLESDIQLNLATLERARLDLAYTVIKAPISGNVGMIQVTEGNVIKANDDRTLCVINQLDPVSVSFALPERYLTEVLDMQRSGSVPVEATPASSDAVSSQSGQSAPAREPVRGFLSAMDNAVDTTTGTIRLRAQFDNAEKRLWPGQFVRVGLVLRDKPDALLIPTSAVLDGIQGSYVYVITPDNKAEARQITVDFLSGKNTVLASGLAVGERVVLDGQVRLAPGMTVEVRPQPGAAPQSPQSTQTPQAGQSPQAAPQPLPAAGKGE